MSVSRALVNNFIAQKKGSIDNKYRPRFHMSPDVGWMNDPNGLVYFKGQYHLYYQANPYRTKPGQMMWGHFISSDLIRFEDQGIALSLDSVGENAFSGGAIIDNEQIHIYYTLHTEKHPSTIRFDGEAIEISKDDTFTEKENEKRKHGVRINEGKDIKEEEIYHSVSSDGSSYERGNRVFGNETLPSNLSQTDFRDPNPVKIGDSYYIFIGGKDIQRNAGVIIVLKGDSLDHFEYAFVIGPFYELGDMAECPSYFRINDKDVFIVSGCNVYRRGNDFKNINSSVFIVGNLDLEAKKMHVDFIQEIDKGDCFYAPQFIRHGNRAIMVGWMENWAKNYPTSILHHGYVGAFTLPREISLVGKDIYQQPIAEFEQYCKIAKPGYLPRLADISMRIEEGASLVIQGDNGALLIGNDNGVYLDNTQGNGMFDCIRRTNARYKSAQVRIILDTSSIEIFVDNGKEVITSRFYIDGNLALKASAGVEDIVIKEVVLP